MDSGPGIPGWFIAIFAFVIVAGIGTTIWRISVTRRMAEDAGLDPNTATAVSLLSKDGVDAAFLASALRQRPQPPAPPPVAAPAQSKSAEQRLHELQGLRDKGLITQSEYETRRQEILGSI